MEAGFHGGDRKVQDVRDLGVRPLLEVAKHEHLTELRRQGLNGFLHLVLQLLVQQLLHRPRREVGDVDRRLPLFLIVDRDRGKLLLPQTHQRRVRGDAVDPRRKRRCTLKRFDATVRAQERVL